VGVPIPIGFHRSGFYHAALALHEIAEVGVRLRHGRAYHESIKSLPYSAICVLRSPIRMRHSDARTATDAYLRRHFGDRAARIQNSPRVIYSCAYEQPLLRRLLPTTSFFRATLLTGEMEYLKS